MATTEQPLGPAKLQQLLEKLCSASVRASAQCPSFRFNTQYAQVEGKSAQIRAAHLRPSLTTDDFRSFRGAADAIALRLKYSDSDLHQQLMPKHPLGEILFEVMEQLRCESLVSDLMTGTKNNLEHRFRQWCKAFYASKAVENTLGLLVFTVVQIVWCRLTRLPMNSQSEDFIEPMRMMLAPHIGNALVTLPKNTRDQANFAVAALAIVDVLETLQPTEPDQQTLADTQLSRADFCLILDPPNTLENDVATVRNNTRAGNTSDLIAALSCYKIYTTEYDEFVYGHQLALPAQLIALAKTKATLMKKHAINIPRLARDLAKILPGRQLAGWDFAKDEGYIDGARISHLITSPHQRSIFRTQQQLPKANALVTFLVDNSGSMKQHLESLSCLIEIFCQALERIGANCEVLGFTTKSWLGGQSYRQWQHQLRPKDPGRVCDTRHIIYKDADSTLHSTKLSLAALLKPDLYREGIDGEALLWAATRMLQRTEQRKLLIVLSDGCPMQSTTNNLNTVNYLDTHLRQVAAVLEKSGQVELYALGVGLDLSPYYRHSLALETVDKIDQALLSQILQLLRLKHRR